MQHQFSLAHLTVLGCSPPDMVYLADRAGYDFVSLRLIPMGVPGEKAFMPRDRNMIRNTRKALGETGIQVLDIELARILSDRDPEEYEPAMEAAEELGARHVISSAWGSDPMDRSLIVERYGKICDLAKPYGLTVELEFPTFSQLTNLQEAVDVVAAAGRTNCGILIDTLYLHFSKVSLHELEALPEEWIHFMHICDTAGKNVNKREELIHIARDDRRYLGEGCINFKPVLDRLPAVPLSIELPNADRVKELGYEGHAKRCLDSAKEYLSGLCTDNRETITMRERAN